jgi:hypothetical protein
VNPEMPDIKLLLRQMITGWQNEDIPILQGVDEVTIQKFESKYGVKLPEDMREYFSTVNGMGDHIDEKNSFRFWPIEKVVPVQEYAPKFANIFPESARYFLFFDVLYDSSMCAIGLGYAAAGPTPIYEVFYFEEGSRFRYICKSFTEFVGLYLNNPEEIN